MSLNPAAPEVLMQQALALAQQAAQAAEVPVGAILVNETGTVLGAARNTVETDQNPLAHAEMRALQQAIAATGQKYLTGCTLAVTLEPCAMCIAALIHARVGRVVFGAYDVKSGGTVNGARVPQHAHFQPEILGGIAEEDCRQLLQQFFQGLRGA